MTKNMLPILGVFSSLGKTKTISGPAQPKTESVPVGSVSVVGERMETWRNMVKPKPMFFFS